ncbi:MAG: beta-lactamase family protein [Candidatus Zixiibacteriota bacterium]|nr:MAG: beta-lactamase family protein [candidate division Zixibacteria bacterium]
MTVLSGYPRLLAGALLATLMWCGALNAQTAPNDTASAPVPQTLEELDIKLDEMVKERSIPGAAVALVSRDSIIFIGTYGFANKETGEPVTEETHFRVGSCTKSFIGLGFLKLVEEGRIDLNTPVREIAPEIEIDNPWRETHPVRVIHLLEHTAGFDDSHLNWFYFEGPVLPLKRCLEIKANLRTVRWPPGTRCSYSSPGYTLAGYILEKISGQRYQDFLTGVIFEPIGMNTTTIGRTDEHREMLAAGYNKDREPVPRWFDYDEPAGALTTSVKEMALFVQFMLNRGRVGTEQVIRADLIDRMGRPTSTIAARAGLEYGYSFGISSSTKEGRRWFGHGGIVPGFFADYSYNNDCGLGYVVMYNEFAFVIYDGLMAEARGFLACDADSTPAPPARVPAEILESYCGYYEYRSPRMQLLEFTDLLFSGTTILYANDTLYQQDFMSDKSALIPVSQNMFRKRNHPGASRVFVETEDGKMVYASQGSYYERTAGWKPLVHRAFFFVALLTMLSGVAYGLFWIPVHLYKKVWKKGDRSPYLWMRIIPLLAVLSLVLGVMPVADQTMLQFGQMTVRNVIFFISTLVFAGLSVVSVYTTYKSFFKPVSKFARVYATLLSSACLGMTLYFGYWGLIGLRTWSY